MKSFDLNCSVRLSNKKHIYIFEDDRAVGIGPANLHQLWEVFARQDLEPELADDIVVVEVIRQILGGRHEARRRPPFFHAGHR